MNETTGCAHPSATRPTGASGAKALEFLAFTLGQEEYGIDIQKVQELRRYDTVTRIANVPEHIKGVVNLRGIIVPIIDMRIKFNLSAPTYDQFTVVIILNMAGRVIGMVVDSVSDVITLTPEQVKPSPEMGSVLDTEYLIGLGTLDERMLILVDLEKLMTSDDVGLVEKNGSLRSSSFARTNRTATTLFGLSALLLLGCPAVFAQQLQRPDAGTLQERQRQIPLLPQPGASPVSLPQVKPAEPDQSAVRITPAAFRIEGNTVFDSETLAALLAERTNQPTDLAGLTEAAGLVSRYYRTRAYLLTEAYLPEQAFQAAGGTVTIAVIEARIGRVQVRVEGDKSSASYARRVVAASLMPGALITEYLLDKPVLLLRDLAGMEASATVEPGEQAGQANVTVTLRPQGTQVEGSVGVDNFGASAVGALRLTTSLNFSNLADRGDVLSVQAQASEASRSHLYRLAYTVPVAANGIRLALSAARADYALGKQFAALGATGHADILGVSLTRPLIRARENNLYGLFSLEHKKFRDQIATPANDSARQITSARLGVLGNFVDAAAGTGGSSSYALSATRGRAKLDPLSLGFDQGVGGLQTAGSFTKLNLELQRVQFFGSSSSMHLNLRAQLASKNLASAEKMALGGPTGVRGYPVGEGIGDAGLLLNLEYRYQLPAPVTLPDELVSLTAFYHYGTVRFNQDGVVFAGAVNRMALGSVGIGALAGRVNHFLMTAHLAWRTTRAAPSTGDPDLSPRAWVSAQKWF